MLTSASLKCYLNCLQNLILEGLIMLNAGNITLLLVVSSIYYLAHLVVSSMKKDRVSRMNFLVYRYSSSGITDDQSVCGSNNELLF